MLSRPLWLVVGTACLACGAAGVVLPLVPATPFLLLAAFAFARSSPRFHSWLLDHPQFGRLIEDWRRHGSIARKVKAAALLAIAATLLVSVALGFAWWLVTLQALALACVALFIVTRPDTPRRIRRAP